MAQVKFRKSNDTVTVDYSNPASQAELVQIMQAAGYQQETEQTNQGTQVNA